MNVSDSSTAETFDAVERGGIGVYFWNPVTEKLTWDDTLGEIFAARSGEDAFAAWSRRVHPDDRERVLITFSKFDEAEDLYRIVLDDGSFRHILARATHVVRGPDGVPTSVSGVMLDVTTTQQVGARLVAMLETISEGFCTFDRGYRFTYLNRRAETVLGMGSSALVGRTMWDAFPHMLGSTFEASYRLVMENRVPAVFEEYYPEPLNMWIEVRAQPSEEGMVVYFQDVTERRARSEERERLLRSERKSRSEADQARQAAEDAQRQLAYQATHDSLTGILSRSEFERIAAQRLSDARHLTTALFLDLDRFKLVNDSLGHAAGDALLVEIATRIGQEIRVDDVAARLGGDEFVILLQGLDAHQIQNVAERVLAAVREPVQVGDYTVSTSASIGLAVAGRGATVATLLRDADVALYRAKDAGRDRLAWFDVQAHHDLVERIALERDLRAALNNDELDLHYQAILDLKDHRVAGVEALSRWNHCERGNVPPDVFIPLAEDTGLIRQLGENVIRAGVRQAALWSDMPDFIVWVNVSGRQFDTPGLASLVLSTLASAGVPPCRFGIEVTESVLSNEAVAGGELAEMSRAGIPIAIDDFGTGYSSMARLGSLPLDVLKIDRSFIKAIDTQHGRASVDVTVHLARSLGFRTVAEGVETAQQLQLMHEAGVDSASGFLLARPVPAHELDPSGAAAALAELPSIREPTSHEPNASMRVLELETQVAGLAARNQSLQRDLTERTTVEAGLRASEAELQGLLEALPQIVWVARPDGWHVFFNRKWMDFTGLSLAESLGHGWNPPFHPEDRPRAAARWEEATRTGEPYEIEYRLRRADGEYHWMLGRAVPLRNATGEIVKWFGTCTDIEDLKQAQERVGDQARLLDETQDAIMVQDLQHRVVYWNRGSERIYGWTAAEALGRPLDELVSFDMAEVDTAFHTLLANEKWSGELRYADREGVEVLMEGRWTLLRDADGIPKAALSVNTDVTERRAIEAQFLQTLKTRATHDPLTGLANRALLFDRLELLIGRGAGVAVAFLDLDGFKAINDELGHRAGDQVIINVADRLKAAVRDGDVVARIGGDEFVVAGPVSDEPTALRLGDRLAAAVGGVSEIDGVVVAVSASVGVAFVGAGDSSNVDELLHRADAAMYQAKRRSHHLPVAQGPARGAASIPTV